MRTIRQEMKDERAERREAEVRMIRSLEETVKLSSQSLWSLQPKNVKSVIQHYLIFLKKCNLNFISAILCFGEHESYGFLRLGRMSMLSLHVETEMISSLFYFSPILWKLLKKQYLMICHHK